MKKQTRILVLLIVILMGAQIAIIGFNQPAKNLEIQSPSNELRIKSDTPIDITKNEDFDLYKSEGNGSVVAPYIIEDYVINGSGLGVPGISIRNTNAYFILRNCTVRYTDAGVDGIYLETVGNGTLEENIIEYNGMNGIQLVFSDHNTVINNTCIENDGVGIRLNQSDYCDILINHVIDNLGAGIVTRESSHAYIFHNTVDHNERGIRVQNAHYTIVDDNIVKNNVKFGVHVDEVMFISAEDQIINNLITNNGLQGILCRADKYLMYNNTITKSGEDGIEIQWTGQVNVTKNIINNNAGAGILISEAGNNYITWNTIHGNSECIVEESITANNTIENNDCKNSGIPGFNWILASTGLLGVIFAFIKRRQII